MSTKLIPEIVTVFKEGYTRHQFIRDLGAGVIVGIVSLPLAIAFAIASGVNPEQGVYTAIVAGFVIALLGGSRAQVSGPTGAFIVVVAAIVQQYGYEGLAMATFIAGILLVLMGLMGLGQLLKFVPYPLTVGFTSGIALIIFSTQINDFLGLQIRDLPVEFITKWCVLISEISRTNPWALLIGALTLLMVIYLPRIHQKIPAALTAILVTSFLVGYFALPVETIGGRFGAVPSSLPSPRLLSFDWETFRELFRPAITIALLGGIESLLSAVVADGMLGTRHRSNMELVAQGAGNIISPLFLGIPATGAIARTATNVKNGGRTPVAAIVHALVLLIIIYFLGSFASLIPMPALAAILIYVAYNMSEWHAFLRSLKYPKSDVAVLLTTFLLTVLIDLTVAIEVGVVLAAFLFVKRMEETAGVTAISEGVRAEVSEPAENESARDFKRADVPAGVEVFEVFGPIFFSAVDRFTNSLSRLDRKPKIMILFMQRVAAIDGSGIRAIQSIQERMLREHRTLIIAGASGQTLTAILRAEVIPAEQIFKTLPPALEYAAVRSKMEESRSH